MTAVNDGPRSSVPGRALTTRDAPVGPVVRKFRPDIEGLRAIAVVLVVLYHAGVTALPGGYVGVDVFLVVSGYLITSHLLSGLLVPTPLRAFFADFYARRVRRLLPLASLVIVATTATTWYLISALPARVVAVDALWAAGFAMNVHLARSGVDYQANQNPSPLQHFWSLAVEEQFYLFWPLLLAVAILAFRRVGLPARTGVLVSTGIVMAASLVHSVQLTATEPTQAYFSTAARAWELGVGAMVAVAAPHLAALMARCGRVVPALLTAGGLALIVVAAVRFTVETPFPGVAAAVPVGGAALVIAAGLVRATAVESIFLSRRSWQYVGRLSYGWYLWHWPVLILAAAYLQRPLHLLESLVLVAVAFWMAMCSAIAVERPLRTYTTLIRDSARTLKFGAILVLVTVLVAVGVAVVSPRLLGLSSAAAAVVTPAEMAATVIASQDSQVVPANVTPSLADAADDKPDLAAADGGSCMVGLLSVDLSTDPGAGCVAGGTEGGRITVVLVGDSHAYQWVPALREIAIERDWRLVSLTKSGCPLYDVEMVNTQLKRRYDECSQWREKVYERIDAEKPALVITSAAVFSERAGDFTERWTAGVDRTVRRLATDGIPTVVLADTPYPRRDVPECVTRNPTDLADTCSLPVDEAMSDPVRRSGTIAAARAAGATVIDPQPWFCGPSRCPVVVGPYLVYSDNSHMTATYSRALASLLGARLPDR